MAFDSVEVASLNIQCGYFELGVFQQVDAFFFMNYMTVERWLLNMSLKYIMVRKSRRYERAD